MSKSGKVYLSTRHKLFLSYLGLFGIPLWDASWGGLRDRMNNRREDGGSPKGFWDFSWELVSLYFCKGGRQFQMKLAAHTAMCIFCFFGWTLFAYFAQHVHMVPFMQWHVNHWQKLQQMVNFALLWHCLHDWQVLRMAHWEISKSWTKFSYRQTTNLMHNCWYCTSFAQLLHQSHNLHMALWEISISWTEFASGSLRRVISQYWQLTLWFPAFAIFQMELRLKYSKRNFSF